MKKTFLSFVFMFSLILSSIFIFCGCDSTIKEETKYTINFDTNGAAAQNSITQNYGTDLTLPTPTKEGYIFEGWYDSETNDNGSGTKIEWTTMPAIENGSTPLYAKWNIDTGSEPPPWSGEVG